jgi:glycine/D-amino acid oxidase-like deaminating enzyme
MRSKCLKQKKDPILFYFDDKLFEAMPGDTIAAALTAAGQRVGRHTQKGNPRHVFCGIGVCFECMVIIKGVGIARACMTKVVPDMQVESWPLDGLPDCTKLAPLGEAPTGNLARVKCQLVVIGAGPGGIAAAISAAQCGVEVLVIDERPSPGGQFYKQLIPSMASITGHPLDQQYADGQELIAEAKAAGVRFLSGALVWRALQNDAEEIELSIYHDGKAVYYQPDQLIIATGSYDEPLPVPGWTLPGVMTAGAAQTLVRRYGVVPTGPILVTGSGPLVLQVAYELVRAGGEVAAVVSSANVAFDKLPDLAGMLFNNPKVSLLGAKYLKEIIAHKVPLIRGHVLSRVEGKEKCEIATIIPVDSKGKTDPSKARNFNVGTVCQGYGLLPANEVPRQLGCRFEPDPKRMGDLIGVRGKDGQSSLESVHIVGEAGGIVGGYMGMCQGYLAGWRVAEKFGKKIPKEQRIKVNKEFEKHEKFQDYLWHALSGPPIGLELADDDTHICRCEEVTLLEIKKVLLRGVTDMGSLKRLTRAGMGRCQGRYCGPFLSRLLSEKRQQPLGEKEHNVAQPPLKPIPLPILAVEKKEWGGHKRSSLGEDKHHEAQDHKIIDTDVLIIGAGIAGCSTAFWLAKEGRKAIIVDKGSANGQASGGNAGSMHVQLLSFDYGAKAEAGGHPAIRTLLLQREAAIMWKNLEKELGKDFEIKTVGGLMVAENKTDIEFLEKKAAAERSVGINVEVIGSQELHRIAPEISDVMIAASFCPEEGKINPLVATQGLLDAALEAGQELHTSVDVLNIEQTREGFVVHTSNARYKCRKIVNAAGAWASRVSAMVGNEIPVHGAPLQMIITEPVAPVVSHLIAHADRHLTMKQANNGNFIIGGGWTAGWNKAVNFPTALRDSLEGNVWVARRTIPCLDSVHIIRSWGAMNINIDGAPIVGEMGGVPGFYNTVTSNGYTLGPLMGKVTSDLISRGRTEWDISFCSLDRFS